MNGRGEVPARRCDRQASAMIITKTLTTAEELARLRPSWAAILEANRAASQPFFSWEWFEASVNAFAGDGSRYVVALQEHERTIAILPLVRRKTRQYGMTIYELTFCPNFNTPRNDLLVAGPQHAREAARTALNGILADRRSWHILRLENIPCGSELSKLLVESEEARRSPVIRSEGWRSPCVDIGGHESFDDYFATSIKKHYRTKLRRDLKRLQQAGEDWSVDYFDAAADIARGLEDLFEIRRASWKGEAPDNFVRFFQEISPVLANRRELLITILRVGGRPVAGQYFVRKDGDYCMILNDHDDRYHDAVTPGTNLPTLVLQEAFKRHWKVLAFSGCDYEYKRRLATTTRAHYSFQVFNPGLKSQAAYFGKTRALPLMREVLGRSQSLLLGRRGDKIEGTVY